jgi:hypothetical protein
MKPTTKSISGTSFYGSTIKATVNQLISICGQPYDDSNTGRDKVNFEWNLQTYSGDVFTIYDWKEYRIIGLDEVIEWHIGGRNEIITIQAYNELKAALQSTPSLSDEELNEMLQDEYERKLDTDEVAE